MNQTYVQKVLVSPNSFRMEFLILDQFEGSLTPANFESHGDKEMKGLQMKYEEESTIRLIQFIGLDRTIIEWQ